MILELAAPALELRKFLLSLLAAAAASWARRPELMTERSCSSCCDAAEIQKEVEFTLRSPTKMGIVTINGDFFPFLNF
jgi:hypothetical protein